MKRTIIFLIVIVIGSCVNMFAQGKITRLTKQTATSDQQKQSTSKVAVSAPDGYINGHGYVDLGLPSKTKWATCNIGATSPEAYGSYFAWGETATKKIYVEMNSLTYGKDRSTLYNEGIINSNGILTPSHDAASAQWTSNWKMPTGEEMKELFNNCSREYTIINGRRGLKLTGPNLKTIFLPAAGGYDSRGKYSTTGWNGMYLTSEYENIDCAIGLSFWTVQKDGHVKYLFSTDGYTIRAVTK